jgi:hypothetical protein
MTAIHHRTTGRTDPDPEPGDILYETETGAEHAVIVDTDAAGVTMRRGDTEWFVPRGQFARWNHPGLVVETTVYERPRTERPSDEYGPGESTNRSVESARCRGP